MKKEHSLNVTLSDVDILFIYMQLHEDLKKLDTILFAPDCPLDKQSIKNQRDPFISVMNKLSEQYPNLTRMDKYL